MSKINICFLSAILILLASCCMCEAKEVKCEPQVKEYELNNGFFSAKFTNYGATLLSVMVPDKNGKMEDIVLGYDSVNDYKNDKTYFGAIVGRVANDGKNTLHGGSRKFGEVIWTVQDYYKDGLIRFAYDSFDGSLGNLSVKVTYVLGKPDRDLLVIIGADQVKKATPVDLGLHTYWNLGGHNSGDVLSHTLQLLGSKITPTQGKTLPVKGTPYDFRQPREIGSMFNQLPNGYDMNYVLDRPSPYMEKVAVLQESKSGRKMVVKTNAPWLHLYTSNSMLKNVKGKNGSVYPLHAGICFATQEFPDAVNNPNFPSQIVGPGLKRYGHGILFRFTP